MTFSNTPSGKDQKVLAVIPARLQSTRLPEKPLADILGKPMIQWVYEKTSSAERIDKVVVATDNERILNVVTSFGGLALMTAADHQSGTDRLVEVASHFPEYETIINVQGDEPMISPDTLDFLIHNFLSSQCETMGTLAKEATDLTEAMSPDCAKVVINKDNTALYFSRSLIPFDREQSSAHPVLVHIGIYIYKREFLLTFPTLGKSRLETTEKLEQLRVLENGFPISVFVTESSSMGVDTPEDLQLVRKLLAKNS